MESSQVFLNKVMLNIATSKDQGLNLVKGEVLRGVVQEVKADGLVSLLIKGQVIDAVSEVPVKPGQQLQLMVEDFRDGKTYLKALTPELLERIENTNLSMNLKDIGVAAKDTNIVMAKKLLAHNLPVTVNNLNELSKGMNLLGGVNARNLEITAFAMQRGITINQHNLNSLAQFTAPGSSLTQLVKDILQNLASLERLSADGQAVPAKQGTGEESARLQLNQASAADKSQTQSGVNNPRIIAQANLSPGGKGNQEAGLQIKADNSGENAASAGKAATAESGAVLSKSESEASQQQGKEVSGAKTPANAEKISMEVPKPAAGKAGPEQVFQVGEKAGSAGKANTVETGTALSKAGSEVPQQQGKEVLGAKTPANAEKLSMEVPKPAAGKAGPEQVFQVGEKAGSAGKANTVETGTALSKAASEVPQQQGKEVLGTKTPVNAEKLSMEVPKPVAGKAGPEQVFQAGEKAGSEQMKQAQATPAPGIHQESIDSKNAAGGEKTLADVSKQLVNKMTGDQAPPSAAKTNSDQGAAIPGKNSNNVSTNMINEKNQAPAGGQINIKLGLESVLASTGPERAAAESLIDSGKNNPQTSSSIKQNEINPGQDKTIVTAATDSDSPNNSDKLVKHLDLLKPLLDILRIDSSENKASMGAKLENAVFSEKELIRGLMLLEDIIKNDNSAAKNPLINDLLQKIDGLEKDLSGQRILNIASRSAVDNSLNYFYFSFPVQVGNEYRLGQIRINKELGRKGLKNLDNIRFIVSLDTAEMGLVLFHLNWKRSKEIEVQGIVENQNVCNHLTRNIEVLLQGLNDLGYKTKNLGIKVVEEQDEIGNLRMQLEETPLNIRPLGIDITV